MNKYEKIHLVRMLGLNTEENILITNTDHEDLLLLQGFIDSHNLEHVSIRTLSFTGEKKTPHYPIVEKKDIILTVTSLAAKGYGSIVATPINPQHALLAGAVLKHDNTYIVELTRGPYTVRRVTHDGIIDISFDYTVREGELPLITIRKMYSTEEDEPIKQMIDSCIRTPFKNCIIELSYYKIPVGYKKEHVIIWDIDGDGTYESARSIEDYYYSKLAGEHEVAD